MSRAKLTGIVVRFGGVKALSQLDLTVEPGVIHGLIGPNGAGKSTALNVLCGMVAPAAGAYTLDGRPAPKGPVKLARLGIARTFQTPAIFRNLTILENVMTGGFLSERVGLLEAICRFPSFARKEGRLRERARDCLRRLRLDIDDDAKVDSLSLGHLRKIELARAMMCRPRLLLLDEVTSGLTEAEVAEVAALIREIACDGREQTSIVVVEHNVPFIFDLCEVVSAMTQGRMIVTGAPDLVRREPRVIRSYLGEPSSRTAGTSRPRGTVSQLHSASEPILTVKNVDLAFGATPVLKGASLEVRPGEIVALLGRNGAGKSTLAAAVTGAARFQRGSIRFLGRDLGGLATSEIVRRGVGLAPQLGGIAARQSVRDNLEIAAFGLKDGKAARRERTEELLELFPNLRQRLDVPAGALSGGERKMLAIANVMVRNPRFIIFDEPSLGLSPTMVAEIQRAIGKIKDLGVSAIIAEQNVGWLDPLAERAYLLDLGRIVAEGRLAELAASELISNAYLGRRADGPRVAGQVG